MSHQEEIKYLQMALKMQGLNLGEYAVDQIINTYLTLKSREGDMTLKDIAEIENYIKKTYGRNGNSICSDNLH